VEKINIKKIKNEDCKKYVKNTSELENIKDYAILSYVWGQKKEDED